MAMTIAMIIATGLPMNMVVTIAVASVMDSSTGMNKNVPQGHPGLSNPPNDPKGHSQEAPHSTDA